MTDDPKLIEFIARWMCRSAGVYDVDLPCVSAGYLDQHHREATVGVPLWLAEREGLV